jgi:ATP-dependent Clp protease, protease subunit
MRQLIRLLLDNARRGAGLKAQGGVIQIDGPIVSDEIEAEFFGGIAPAQMRAALAASPGAVHLRINSPGGDVFAARAMAQAIREHPGDVVAHVDGVAASAASLIVVAASRAIMAPGTMLMIHKSWTLTAGNADEHVQTAALLEKVDAGIAASYAAKGKSDAAAYARMMAVETWFSADEALAEGLVDEALEDGPKAQAAGWNLGAYAAAPYLPKTSAPAADPEPEAPADSEPEPSAPAPDIEAMRRRLAARLI